MTTIEKKTLSLDELSSFVRNEFNELLQQMAREQLINSGGALMVNGGMPMGCTYWIIDIYPDYLVCAESAGEYYRVPFTFANGDVEFAPMDQWTSVEKEWVDATYPNAAEEMTADMEGKRIATYDDVLVGFGGEVKAIGDNGEVGGHLIIFGDAKQADFAKDFFKSTTDFGVDLSEPIKGTIRYHHGMDKQLKTRKLGSATIGVDKIGIWVKGQLDLHDEWQQAVYELVKNRKTGWSSAAGSHLVEREPVDGAQFVKSWPLVLADLTITPTPCDYRQVVQAKSLEQPSSIKSLITSLAAESDQPEANVPETAQAVVHAGDADNAKPTEIKSADESSAFLLPPNEDNGENTMPEATQAAPVENAEFAALKSQFTDLSGKLDIILKAPAIKTAEVAQPESEAEIKSKDQELAVKAFEHYARTGEVTKSLKAAYTEGTSSTGGYLVPIQYSNDLVIQRRYLSILRAAGAKVIKVQGTNSFKVPTLTDSTAAILTSEAGAFSEVEATFGEVPFVPYKYTKLVKASDEVLNDSRIPLMDIIGPDATQAFAAAENTAFTTGTGSSQPQGVVTGASAGVTAAGVAAITADEVIDLYHSLADLYRMNAVWMMSDTALKLIRKLKDTTNQYLWSPGLAAGEPSTILGRPVYINNSMAVPATGVKSVLFGDLSYFWIADFGGEEMKRLNELYAGTGQIGFRWYSRFDSHVMLSAALKVLTQA
jgi:HK97 family phage major capsid protein